MTSKKNLDQISQTQNFFDDLAKGWSARYKADPQMALRVNRFRVILAALNAQNSAVLDFGCGSGVIANALAEDGFRMYATDISAEMIAQGQKMDDAESVIWRQYQGVGAIDYEAESFDAVISSSVFEYIDQPHKVMSEIHALLKPGGFFAFTVPDLRDPHRKKEGLLNLAASTPVLSAILRKSRWSEGIKYLKLSKSRFDFSGWREICGMAGFELDPIESHTGPLVMLIGRKGMS